MELETKYGFKVNKTDINGYLSIQKNKIYKLLPLREEGLEWDKFLNSILVELSGFNKLFDNKVALMATMAKLEGLYEIEDFMVYRKTIFECLNSIDELE
ncbi:hypothetical protein [Clostridium sp.]|uniref:hypothetical protein n=1 Tax=Clostridium sp. TaxID=1506 RepID=UPI002FC8B1C2